MIDFQQVSKQVQQLGKDAPERQQELQEKRRQAQNLLEIHANELENLRQKVAIANKCDERLRCAVPVDESLAAHFPVPHLPASLTVLAVDGSQINPNRHEPVQYGLINIGSIQMSYGFPNTPIPSISSELIYGEAVYRLNEDDMALKRDLAERQALVKFAEGIMAKDENIIITFTDGPIELWGEKNDSENNSEFGKSLKTYLAALRKLQRIGILNAGYVDKPGDDLVIRLLEIASAPEKELADFRHYHPLRGTTDIELYRNLLKPGERSAIFAMCSKSAKKYTDGLSLHFFYLNVGHENDPWLVRVDVPAWVVGSPDKLDALHAVLFDQCQMMGNRPYPYLLHRAHEAAVVSKIEHEQVTQMITHELQQHGVEIGRNSHKQIAKGLRGRTKYKHPR